MITTIDFLFDFYSEYKISFSSQKPQDCTVTFPTSAFNPLPAGACDAQNPRYPANMTAKVERDCSKLRRSQMKFFSTTEREMSGDSVYRLQSGFSSHPTSSSSPRIFQIDVLEHFIFMKTTLLVNGTQIILLVRGRTHGWQSLIFLDNNEKYSDNRMRFSSEIHDRSPNFWDEMRRGACLRAREGAWTPIRAKGYCDLRSAKG